MPNHVTGYNRTQITLHWIIAALVVFQFVGHEAIVDVSALIAKGQDPAIPILARAHVLLGILTLILAIWRVVLRLTRGAPDLPAEESAALKMVAKITHLALYGAIFIMPLSGMGAWFGGQEFASTVHLTFKFVVIISVALHVAGALYQQYVLKTGLLKRMMKAE
mgnify:CR=1 FL=1